MRQKLEIFILLAALSTPWVFLPRPANAALDYTIIESNGNLVVGVSGSLNLPTASSNGHDCVVNGRLFSSSSADLVCTGVNNPNMNKYVLSGGSTMIFQGDFVFSPAFSVTGLSSLLLVYVSGVDTALYLDPNYVSGTSFTSTATFNSMTLADIGLTPTSGLLGTWTLSNGEAVNLSVASAPVPGPLPALGAAAAFGFSRRLRQRIQLSKASTKG